MPVKLPTLERNNQVVEPASSGQIKANSIDVASGHQRLSKAIVAGGERMLSIYEKTQREAYDSRIAELGHQLDRFGREKLEGTPDDPKSGLRHLRGNPDEAYGKFDNELGQKRDSLLSGSGLEGKHLERAKGVLNRRYNNVYNSSLNYYGIQNARYKTDLANATVEIANRDAYTALAEYNPKDEKSLEPFKQAIDEIATARLKEARSNGWALEVPANHKGVKYRVLEDDGTATYLSLENKAREKVLGDISKTTYNSINGMIKSNKVGAARELIKLYGDQLGPVYKAKIDESFEKKDIEVASVLELGELDHLTYKERSEKLKNLPSKTFREIQIKHEARKLNDADARMIENQKKRASTDMYEPMMNQLQTLVDPNREGGASITDIDSLENAMVNVNGEPQKFKDAIVDVTNPKQRKALYNLVGKRSEKGDDKVFAQMMDMAKSGALQQQSFSHVQQMGNSLNSSQFKIVQSQWLHKGAKGRTGYNKLMSMAIPMGIVKANSHTKRIFNSSLEDLQNITTYYYDVIAPLGEEGYSTSELEKMTMEYLRGYKNGKRPKAPPPKSHLPNTSPGAAESIGAEKVSPGTAASSGFDSLSNAEVQEWVGRYRKETGATKYSRQDVKEFYEKSVDVPQ